MAIHTIGDSHSYAGWSGVYNHHLGAVLCYSFGKDPLNRCDIRNFDIKHGDTIVFCLGEIDCRAHIHKHITDTKSYRDIIDNIVDKYFEGIQMNVLISELKLKNVCVYNVVPPIQKNNQVDKDDMYYLENPYVLLATDEERKQYTLYFNKKLKEKCIEYNYIFFDIYDKYMDEAGFLRKDLSDGNIHIGNGTHIISFKNKNL